MTSLKDEIARMIYVEVHSEPGKGKTFGQVAAQILSKLESVIPEKKHHIESDRNIAYREGWNDYRQTLLRAIRGEK